MRHSETIVWPGGEHPFRLGIGELRAIEQRSDAGTAVVMMRLLTGQWRIDDVVATLRLGLIGAGMPERDAQKTVDAALEIASPYKLTVIAARVIKSFIMWDDGDGDQGEAVAAGTQTIDHPSATAEQDGRDSTVQEPS